jgi:hypothetical protein
VLDKKSLQRLTGCLTPIEDVNWREHRRLLRLQVDGLVELCQATVIRFGEWIILRHIPLHAHRSFVVRLLLLRVVLILRQLFDIPVTDLLELQEILVEDVTRTGVDEGKVAIVDCLVLGDFRQLLGGFNDALQARKIKTFLHLSKRRRAHPDSADSHVEHRFYILGNVIDEPHSALVYDASLSKVLRGGIEGGRRRKIRAVAAGVVIKHMTRPRSLSA